MEPDVAILAAGAGPALPDIPGIDAPHVVQAWDLLQGRVGVGKRVAVLGGNAVGLETALYLAHIGTLSADVLYFLMANRAESMETLTGLLNRGIKEVTVVEMTDKAGQDIGLTTRWTIQGELKRLGVTVLTRTKAVGITPEGLEVERRDGPGLVQADSIVIAAGSRSENRMADEIKAIVPEVYVIGDAKSPRNALHAIREGFEAGLAI
jgi:2,4-dienoyl-CoA reductase (NADPH2)